MTVSNMVDFFCRYFIKTISNTALHHMNCNYGWMCWHCGKRNTSASDWCKDCKKDRAYEGPDAYKCTKYRIKYPDRFDMCPFCHEPRNDETIREEAKDKTQT